MSVGWWCFWCHPPSGGGDWAERWIQQQKKKVKLCHPLMWKISAILRCVFFFLLLVESIARGDVKWVDAGSSTTLAFTGFLLWQNQSYCGRPGEKRHFSPIYQCIGYNWIFIKISSLWHGTTGIHGSFWPEFTLLLILNHVVRLFETEWWMFLNYHRA